MKARKRLLCLLLAALMLVGMLPAMTFAITGGGTESNPYIITTYDELRAYLSDPINGAHYKLGKDIVQTDTRNAYSIYLSKKATVYLDLNGHTLSRTAMSTDTELFVLSNGYDLWIDDSVGGGKIEACLYGTATITNMFLVYGGSKLTITGGTYDCIVKDAGSTTVFYSMGDLNIKGGTFKSSGYALNQIDGNVTIENGSFYSRSPLSLSSNGNCTSYIERCELFNTSGNDSNHLIYIGGTGSACSRALKDHLAPQTEVYVDGSKVTLNDDSGFKGLHAVLTCPYIVKSVTFNANYSKDCTKVENVSCTLDGYNVPATVEVRYAISGSSASALTPGSTMRIGFYVTLPDGYAWSSDRTSSWNGVKPSAIINNASMPANQRGFAYTVTVPKPTVNPFTDVKSSDYFYEPVLWAVANDITKGTSDTTFSPAATCTRGQVVTFLWRAAGKPAPTKKTNPFIDVKSSEYYYDAVLWAVENGITAGISSNEFAPNNPCTRGQVVTFQWRAAGQPALTSSVNPFTDVKNGEYYYDAVLWAVGKGITQGETATTFAPDKTCTRGQIVTFLYRQYK